MKLYKKCSYIVACLLVMLPCMVHAQGLRIAGGASVVVQGDAKLVLNDAGFSNDGNFMAGNSTVMFTGDASKNHAFISGRTRIVFNNVLLNRPYNEVLLTNDISVSGILSMQAGNLELNNYRLDLGSTGSIAGEHINSRITGTKGGVVVATAMLNAPSQVNPGNIGVELSSRDNLGLTVITRGHVQQVDAQGRSGIHRYYDVQPAANASSMTVRFHYLEPELAGNNESQLVLWSSKDALAGWTTAGKENGDIGNNWVTKNNISSASRFTLGLADAAMAVKRANLLPGISSVQAYPNPARDRVTVSFYNASEVRGSMSLQDEQGRVLERRQLQYVKGMNATQWNIAKYAAGTYYLVFEGMGMTNLKIVKQ